ncbi:DUF3549 family protein [Zobellella maritima]|uniref:DUF3549 family protein n=1 Tax=Zobellella maritima TaxID=2059725 RepID=UPI000E308198|nr:DUF3549 family protein [Zobellella maritima]
MQINTLSEFLTQAGTQFRLYDLGRRLQPLKNSDFEEIEAGRRPYPWPLQRHAWLAVSYWLQAGQQPYIWFLKLPLDERGLLSPAAVKHFLSALVEQLGQDLGAPLTEAQQQQLAQTPFTFQPAQDKLAAFHARLSLDLGLPPSAYLAPVQAYLEAPEGDSWQALGLQGLADLVARLPADEALCRQLGNRLFSLPLPVQNALLSQCEHHAIPHELARQLLAAISPELERQTPDEERIALLLRATAGCAPFAARRDKLSSLLAMAPGQTLMLTIAARLWQELTDETLLFEFLDVLAGRHAPLFNGLFAELVSTPALRPLILANLHNPALSEQLRDAIGNLLSITR